MRNVIKAHEIAQQSLKDQINTLQSLHTEELRLRDEALERYRIEIEELELKIEELNACIMNPKCYEEKGLVAVSEELNNTNELYENKVERFLELEELMESF